MKIISNPETAEWPNLVQRPVFSITDLADRVIPIIESVKRDGDAALLRYTKQFDDVELNSVKLSADEISRDCLLIDPVLKNAIDVAYQNIYLFHESQKEDTRKIETSPGVFCWRESRGIEKVGLYVPGGTAPLFSTLLMLGIPAKIAGCDQIVVSTPPDKNGGILPAMAYTLKLLELDSVYIIGGAQAIAAMAIGTETVPKVYKIFGPGNQYVAAAKQIVSQMYQTAVDLPAGPTELLIIADGNAKPEFLASDILSQAEHGADSQVIILSTNIDLLNKVENELNVQILELSRQDVAQKALGNALGIYFESLDQAIDFSNLYAPEHLILSLENPDLIIDKITNAGSVFLGQYTPESFGDYASGTNHTLPTNGAAFAYSGVSLESFQKRITFQKASKDGLKLLGPVVEVMARAEGLDGHALAVTRRLKTLR